MPIKIGRVSDAKSYLQVYLQGMSTRVLLATHIDQWPSCAKK